MRCKKKQRSQMIADNKIDELLFMVRKSKFPADFLSQIRTFPGMTVKVVSATAVHAFCQRLPDVVQKDCALDKRRSVFVDILSNLGKRIRKDFFQLIQQDFEMIICLHGMVEYIIKMMTVLEASF